ncbi:MAG: sporulation peptidase YabG [Defluviitaleaceae bacterium]|nr:sporulation peptidase YabG [Defluviitaleaceae bacterium]
MNIGDIVGRKSYGCDVLFRITGLAGEKADLTGIKYRLYVSADTSDLVPVRRDILSRFRLGFINEIDAKVRKILEKRPGARDIRPGKVLHLDADESYYKLCLEYYEKLGISATGFIIPEDRQPEVIEDLLKEHLPDILIITGHDSLYDKNGRDKMENYRSSGHFSKTVRAARRFNPCKDGLVIIAGACQSNYEALIDAGANIASSPQRILIHALDPVFAAEMIAYSPIDKVLGMEEILENTITGKKGLGGYQTRGALRIGIS